MGLGEGADLDVGDRRERLLAVGVLGGEGQQRGHAQGHAGGHGLGLDPETDPGHHHDQAGWDVGLEHEVAEHPPELEDHHQAGEVPRGVGGGAVLRGVVDEFQLGQLDGFHHERDVLRRIPLKYQIVRGVRYCTQ